MKNTLRSSSSPYLRKEGSVLIICVWALVFFSILSVGIYRITSSQITLAKAVEGRIAGYYLAKAACFDARAELEKKEEEYDSLYKLQQVRQKEFDGRKFKYTLLDEESKININTASAEMLERLPGLKGLGEAVANSELKPFQLKEELLLIDGISEEAFEECKEHITVYSNGPVNVNTAMPEVLISLGVGGDLVANVVNFRRGPDNEEGTADDNVFKSQADINSLGLGGFPLVVKSANYSLQIETEMMARKAAKYTVVLGEDKKIKKWAEY